MELNILDKLNPTCEILGLLYGSKNYDKLMEKSIEMLNESGINGKLFLKNNLKILDKYTKEFKKHMVFEDENELFIYEEEDDTTLFFIVISLFIHEEDRLKSLDSISEVEARKLILEAYYEIADEQDRADDINSLNDILNFVEKQDISNKNKWRFMKILSDSKKSIESIIKAIEENRYAYEQAYKAVEKALVKLIDNTKKYISSGECEIINNISNGEGVFTITPTLALGVSIFELRDRFFVGVLNESIFKEQIKAIGNKGDLVLKLKALSDNSKLETIGLLKIGPKYSLEIAESLNLTSATVSYHMATLLEIGLVSVEKKQGKVYYNLNKVAMQKFIDDLSNVLL